MTTVVAPLAKDQSSELISALEGVKMDATERAIFDNFIAASVHAYTGLVAGKIICLWGLIPPTLLSDQAYLWLYTTPAAEEHQFVLVRRGQIEMKKMLEEYPKIVGHCEVGAERSIRWLKWLGAKFGLAEGALVPFIIERQGA
jgi:hypothetical protein